MNNPPLQLIWTIKWANILYDTGLGDVLWVENFGGEIIWWSICRFLILFPVGCPVYTWRHDNVKKGNHFLCYANSPQIISKYML